MAPTFKKYIICTLFLVSPITFNAIAQSMAKEPVVLERTIGAVIQTSATNQTDIATASVANLDIISNQYIVELSIPKDGFAIATGKDNSAPTVDTCDGSNEKTAYSELARTIIENYKYDFSESFIDILFFDGIDLARKRTT
jgi:hypothetical protein